MGHPENSQDFIPLRQAAGTWDWRPAAVCLDPSCRAQVRCWRTRAAGASICRVQPRCSASRRPFWAITFCRKSIHINVYLCVYGFYVCAFVRVCILACWYVCACMDVLTYVSLCISVHITAYQCISVYICVYVCIFVYSINVFILYVLLFYHQISSEKKKPEKKNEWYLVYPMCPGELPIHPCIYPSICIHIYIYTYTYKHL